jgi:hypothetical protein
MRATLLTLLVAAPLRAQDAVEQAVTDRLARVQSVAESVEASQDLLALGSEALKPLFRELARGDGSLARRATLLAALTPWPRAEFLAFLERGANGDFNDGERVAGMNWLARAGGWDELKLLFELSAAPTAEAPLAPQVQAALAEALHAIARRDRGTVRSMCDLFARVGAAPRCAIVQALERLGGDEGLSALAGLLGGDDPAMDAVLLLALGDAARVHPNPRDLLVFERVRGYFGHPRADLVVLAVLACASLHDFGAVPGLVVLLEDSHPEVRDAVSKALERLTGRHDDAGASAWLAWLDEALAWWDERAPACRTALVSGAPADAATALAEIAHQRLFLQDVAGLLVLATQRSEPDIVATALRALRVLPPAAARPAFLALAQGGDPLLAEKARAVLFSLPSCSGARRQPSPKLPSLTP